MATSSPGSGPASLFPVSNKLKNKVNLLREVIDRKKLEVRRVSKEMRDLIEKKEEQTIRELEAIWEQVNVRIENEEKETQKLIEEINMQNSEMQKIYEKMENLFKGKNQSLTPLTLLQISEKIDSLKREMDISIPYVKVTWRIDELKGAITRMCRCGEQIISYKEGTPYQLKWSKCERGKGDNQLESPRGIATNSMNGNIYVTDRPSHRIQIFSKEGEWIRSVKDVEMKYPENILFHNKSIYVQCYKVILKLNESTEKKEKSKSYGFIIGGICTDNNHIYVGKYKGMRLIVLTLDLIEENRITLQTQFCNQDETEIRDISLTQEEFYILLFETDYPIQAFSREGVLTRCVVQKDSIHNGWCFCLDQQLNIFVSDCGDSKVKIFSNEEKLLTQFGEKGSEKGQFSSLQGISVDELGCVVTGDYRQHNMLQTFSPF